MNIKRTMPLEIDGKSSKRQIGKTAPLDAARYRQAGVNLKVWCFVICDLSNVCYLATFCLLTENQRFEQEVFRDGVFQSLQQEGWMDGWMDVKVDEWLRRWMDEEVDRWIDR